VPSYTMLSSGSGAGGSSCGGMQLQTTVFSSLGIVVSADWGVEMLPGVQVGAGLGAGGTNPVMMLFGSAIWGAGGGAVRCGLLVLKFGCVCGLKILSKCKQKGLWGLFSSLLRSWENW